MRLVRVALIPIFLISASIVHAQYEAEGWRFKPQIGLWFGPVTPVPGSSISEKVGTNLGGGMFFRFNLPTNTWRTEIGTSFAVYDSKGTELLQSWPSYIAISYTIPINLPLAFQVKAGGGANYFRNKPENKHNTHPMLFHGWEISFPAGKWVNIGLRIDYYFVYEEYLDVPANAPSDFEIINGHFFNFGLMVNFNLVR